MYTPKTIFQCKAKAFSSIMGLQITVLFCLAKTRPPVSLNMDRYPAKLKSNLTADSF